MHIIKNLGILGRLIISLILITVITLLITCLGFYSVTRKNVVQLIQKDFHHILQKNNQIIDTNFLQSEEIAKNLISDPNLYRALTDYDAGKINILTMERRVNEVLSRHQFYLHDATSAFMKTSYFTFGNNKESHAFRDLFSDSRLLSETQIKKGAMAYLPTFGQNTESERPADNSLFFAACIVNSSYTENGIYYYLGPEIERPILVISYDANLYQKCFNDMSFLEYAENLVIDEQKNIIYYNHLDRFGDVHTTFWLDQVFLSETGTFLQRAGLEEYIVCYDKSEQTGWYVVTRIPLSSIINENLAGFTKNLVITVLIAIISAVVLSVILSRSISVPIKNLMSAISKSSKGEFHHKVQLFGTPETRLLLNEYNVMNKSIKTLIDENYNIKLREKDAEIKLLHNQLNPHFLYNTLNCINWLALENDDERISEIIVNLSEIMQYTINLNGEVKFIEEYKWLCRYIDIMSLRFENMFTFTADIQQDIFNRNVPKLFLQPIIENIFVHGFKNLRANGLITIKASVSDDALIFVVEDNGSGISQDRLDSLKAVDLFENDGKSIGVQNTHRRIQLMYGEDYGISIMSQLNKGTVVTIKIRT